MGWLKQFSKRSMATGITGGIRVRISQICFPLKSRSRLYLSIGTCLPCVWSTLHSAFVFGLPWLLTAAVWQVCLARLGCAAVLCCAVLCCAVLCCAVLCCAVLCCAMLCPTMCCCAMFCCSPAILCGAGLCLAETCHCDWQVSSWAPCRRTMTSLTA